jgi:glycosyltransferase involved in cell wall biosynthesis
MTEQPLVSVIINCYNGEKYLRETIDSVINQTYINLEIVFWDNQSTDSSKAIVCSYQDDRIHYYYAPTHTPLGEARNLAVEKATGDYINFLDCDDVWSENKLAEQVALLVQDKNEVVYTPFALLLNPEEKYNKVLLRNYKVIAARKRVHNSIYEDLLHGNFIIFSCVLFNTQLFRQSGGISKNFQQDEDYDILLKLSLKTEFACASKALTYYRIHASNNSIANGNLGLMEDRAIYYSLPPSIALQNAIIRNETKIAFYTITEQKQFREGMKILFKKGSVLILIKLLLNKLLRIGVANLTLFFVR